MSSYSPHPDDLEDPPMPAPWRELADAVLPGNREQQAEGQAALSGWLASLAGRLSAKSIAAANPGLGPALAARAQYEGAVAALNAVGGDPTGLSTAELVEDYERLARGDPQRRRRGRIVNT